MSKQNVSQITLVELARRLKLSPGAVSHALNGTASTIRVSPKTGERIRKMAAKLGYRPNRAARILRTGRSGMVGILLRQGFGSLTPVHLYYARKHALRVGLIPFVHEISSQDPDGDLRGLEFMLDAKVDALMVMTWNRDASPLEQAGIPVALIGKPRAAAVPTYFVDQTAGYQMAAQHLLEQGCKRLAFVAADSPASLTETKGMDLAIRAARRKGIDASWFPCAIEVEYDGFMVPAAPGIFGIYASGYLSMKSLIASGKLPDGIVFRSDNMAVGALRACAEEGIRVPKDVAISGFGDHPECSTTTPSLTSVVQPLTEMQAAAFDDIHAALNGTSIPQDKQAVFPCHLVVRESSLRSFK
jgi:DNA-binding LacI/PurR family transcriptional regulator